MSRKNKQKPEAESVVASLLDPSTNPPEASPPKPPVEESDLPEVELVGIQKVQKGYVPVWVKVQGHRVLETDVMIDRPLRRIEAENLLKVEMFKRGILVT